MHVLKLETAGIQKYIFSSNKLKVNLGASYIIEHLLFKELLKSCNEGEEFRKQIENWFKDDLDKQVLKGNEYFSLGYIGGGNAVLYGQEELLKQIEYNFKNKVLQYFPGLEVYTGIVANSADYKESNKILSEKVKEIRTYSPFVNKTFNHGFFNDCAVSGDVAMKYWKNEEKWVSDEVFSKIKYCEDDYQANLKHELDLLTEEQRDIFAFPIDFEDFSGKNEKSYVAIVHIDGNNLGNEFIKAQNLSETQDLSLKTRKLGTLALKNSIMDIILNKVKEENGEYKLGELALNFIEDKKGKIFRNGSNYKLHLPIRPIITGGDDITFVCEGTLGVPLAKQFLENFHKIGKEMGLLKGEIYACAGVAVIKQKYPFYRGYQLSEELIKEAKKASRKQNGNYLSFMIAGYGTGPSLNDLKEKYAKPDLYNDTYSLDKSNDISIDRLESLIKLFSEQANGKNKIPRNKLIEVRNALVNGNIFDVWPTINSRLNIDKTIWNPIENKALTFDAIELADFYNKAYL